MPFGASTLLLASLVLQAPESKPDVRTLQFVLGNPSGLARYIADHDPVHG